MAKSFLVPIQMNQLEILQPLIHLNPTNPSGIKGQVYTDSANNVLKFHDGTNWNRIWDNRSVSQNVVLAGPASGGAGASSFRALVAADIPEIPLTGLGSYADGSLIIGGAADWTTLTAGLQGFVLTMGVSRPEWSSPGAPAAHDLLGTSHNNTVSKASPARGDIIRGNLTTLWEAYTLGAANTILSSDGTDLLYQTRADLNLAYHNGTPTTGNVPAWSATEGLFAAGYGVVTTVGSPGADTNLVTEQGIREALSAIAISALEDIGDVAAYTTLASGEILEWSGTLWTHRTKAEANIATFDGTSVIGSVPSWSNTSGALADGYTIETTLVGGSGALVRSDAIKTYVDGLVAGGVTYKGGYNASTDTPSLDDGTPITGILQGDMYVVTVAGDFFTDTVAVGDILISLQDDPTTLAHWTVVAREWDETFLELGDTPSAYTGAGGYMLMVNSTPNAVEFVNPSTYSLSNFNDDLSYEVPLTFSTGINRTVNTITLDINSLSTVTTLQGVDLFAIYDNSVSGTRNISYTNVLAQIETDLDTSGYTKKHSADNILGTSTTVTHNFGTRDIAVHVYRIASPYDQIECDVEHTDTNNVTIRFAASQTAGTYRIIVIG